MARANRANRDTTRRLELPAPAKVNLGLRIRGRRSDGYHLLESLFVPTELADELELEVASGSPCSLRLELDPEDSVGEAPAGDDNLALRAARAFLAASGLRLGIRIRLRKRIPVGAGLGGGSSDAGGVLRGLSELFPGRAPDLAATALALGADVPFFLDPRPAFVSGIGESIRPVSGLTPIWLLLAHPGFPLATAHVYRAYDDDPPALTGDSAGSTMQPLFGGNGWPVPGSVLTQLLQNDLEPAATRLLPAIAELRQRLDAVGALAVGMSGSGPTLFGMFETEADAVRAEAQLGLTAPARAWRTRTVGSP